MPLVALPPHFPVPQQEALPLCALGPTHLQNIISPDSPLRVRPSAFLVIIFSKYTPLLIYSADT